METYSARNFSSTDEKRYSPDPTYLLSSNSRVASTPRAKPLPYRDRIRRITFDVEIAVRVTERQLARQIAVGTGGLDGQDVSGRLARPEVHVDQRQVDLSPGVVLPLRDPPGRVPERVLLLALEGMPEGVEGLELHRVACLRRDARHRVDGVDLGRP